jgi:Caspase domain
VTAVVLALLWSQAGTPAPPVHRFAVVVGWNAPPRPELPQLRYADDDAVRWTILLQTFGAEVQLLTTLDSNSRRLYGDTLPEPRAPTRAAVTAALDQMIGAAARAKARGARTNIYFVYAGHGDADGDEGYVTLADGRLYRHDLENELLARSTADANHVIVDACRSYFFAYGRGPGGSRTPWSGGSYFTTGSSARFPTTGFLLSSSSDAPSHEWEEFQAGIFSHEVRSGFLGAADADHDGRITYREIAAFVRVANAAVRNERFRPAILARPPRSGSAVLVDLDEATGGQVRIERVQLGRQLLEDAIGVRWADLHPGGGRPVELRLPVLHWAGGDFFVRALAQDVEYRVPSAAKSSLAALEPRQPRVAGRGAAHEAFLQLFAEPFEPSAVARESEGTLEVVDRPGPARPLLLRPGSALVIMGAGAAALGVGGGFLASTLMLAHEGRDPSTSGERREEINELIPRRNRWTAVFAGAGAALLAGGTGLLLWDRHREAESTTVTVAPMPGGAMLSLRAPIR